MHATPSPFEAKFCAHCVNMFAGSSGGRLRCWHPKVVAAVSEVQRRVVGPSQTADCYEARADGGVCGRDANYWQAKA
jgi:hypothetical protein